MWWIILAITWVLVGVLSFVAACIIEYRGKEYDDCDFYDCDLLLLYIVFGYISPVALVLAYTDWKKIRGKLSRFIYKLANIRVKKKGGTHE